MLSQLLQLRSRPNEYLSKPDPLVHCTVDEAEDGYEAPGQTLAAAAMSLEAESRGGKGLQFSDKDEHMYFWFPLLVGLSELTFDPRPDIRYSALEVLSLHIV